MIGIKEVIRAVRFTGLRNTVRVAGYTLARDAINRKYRRPLQPGIQQPPGRLLDARPLASGAAFRFENAALEIVFLAPDLARLSWEPGDPPVPYALARQEWPAVPVTNSEVEGYQVLATQEMQISAFPDGSVDFRDSAGRLLRRELPPLRAGESWTARSLLAPGEHIYGLGEQCGRLDQRGHRHRLWNSDPGGSYGACHDPLYTPIPVYLGLHQAGSYLVFYENYSPAEIEFLSEPAGEAHAAAPVATARFESGLLRCYVILGPPARALERYTELTGRAPLPPLWSLGYHQCRWGYKTESDIRAVVGGFREHGMPLSAIHLDIDYMDGYRVFSVDCTRFPDLRGLAEELHAGGVRLVTILDPGIKQDPQYPVYAEGRKEDIFCKLPDGREATGLVWPGRAAFPDFTDPRARRWWGRQLPRLLDQGMDGFWHDMNEPTSFSGWGGMDLPDAVQHHMEGCGGSHRRAHNLYGLLMDRASYEAMRQHCPERRPWLISRSGWAGMQRYAWNWTGDTESTWAGLRMTLATVLGLGLSGVPFSGPDIGGFSGDPSPELFLRWFQTAAFLPFFRTHSAVGTSRREPWVFGEPYTGILRQFLRMRQQLLPYLYTLAWETSRTGQPIVRPLFWDDLENVDLWQVDDAFLLGSALLVAPVLEAGAASRAVTLPSGAWYDFWSDEVFHSPADIERPTPLERLPLLVRAGSMLPLEEDGLLVLHIYPGTGESRLYVDPGDGYDPGWLESFTLQPSGSGLELSRRGEPVPLLSDGSGAPPGPISPSALPYETVALQLHGFHARRAWLDGKLISIEGNRITPGGAFTRLIIEV